MGPLISGHASRHGDGKTTQSGIAVAPLPDGDAEKIVAECRRCFEEERPTLPAHIRYRMLAIQRAFEGATDARRTFTLEAVFEQIRSIALGGEGIPLRRCRRGTKGQAGDQRSQLLQHSYQVESIDNINDRDFNFYLRHACRRLGLSYKVVLYCVPHSRGGKYHLKRTNRESGFDQPPKPEVTGDVEILKASLGKAALLMAEKGWGDEDVGVAYRAARTS